MAQLVYFSRVREQMGIGEEQLELPSNIDTVGKLVAHLTTINERYSEALSNMDFIRVAVNQNHATQEHPISNTDEIAFFPPVTGG